MKTGDAFDVVGERVRTNFNGNNRQDFAEEDFEIKIRNRKAEPIQVRVVEHLYRWIEWKLLANSLDYRKTDARTIEFLPNVPAGGEAVITYTVHYSW